MTYSTERLCGIEMNKPLDLTDYRGVVIGVCTELLAASGMGSVVEVSDLVQEADVYLWLRRDKIARARFPKAFVRKLAHDAVTDCLRRELRSYIPPTNLRREAA